MGSPLAKHVPVVRTARLVPQVVHILKLLVLLEPMPVVQQPFVIHVLLENTTIKDNKQQSLIVKVVRLVKYQHVITVPVLNLVHRCWYTQNEQVGDARMGVLVGTSRRRQRARRELVWLDGMT